MTQEITLRRWHVTVAAAGIALTLLFNLASLLRNSAADAAVQAQRISAVEQELKTKADAALVQQEYQQLRDQMQAISAAQEQQTAILLRMEQTRSPR